MTATVTVENPPGNSYKVLVERHYGNLDAANTTSAVHPGESLKTYIYGDDSLYITEVSIQNGKTKSN